MSSPEWHDTPKWPEYADFNRRALSRQPSKLSQMSLADVAGVGPGSGLHRTLSQRGSTVGALQCCGQAELHLPPHRWHLAHGTAPHMLVSASLEASANLRCYGVVVLLHVGLSSVWNKVMQYGLKQCFLALAGAALLLCLASAHQGRPCSFSLACQPSLCSLR